MDTTVNPAADLKGLPHQVNLSERRAALSGPPGLRGLIANRKTFLIGLFASLGGFVYGYNQGMFAQVLTMTSFINKTQGYAATTGIGQGILTSILELGAWLGTLFNGYLADAAGRRATVCIAVAAFTVGVIVQACVENKNYIFGGRFAPPEIRGSLVAIQQLSITFGIMVSFWLGYGTNFIGGTGEGQSNAAYLIPICIQLLPGLVLAAGMLMFMPQSPRHLINTGREEECLATLARLRGKSQDDMGIRVEFLEIKALYLFERETSIRKYPQYQDGSTSSNFWIAMNEYKSLLTNKSLFKRLSVACLIMMFQQWNGINAINYYAPYIFEDMGFVGNSENLLATGVVGVVEFLATIPAVLLVDKIGRKSLLITGAIGMAICHFIVAGIIATYENRWQENRSAGWAAVVFVWIYVINFAYSWGPCAWIVVSEVFPLSMRAKGVSVGGSSNWLNNFAVAISTSPFISKTTYGAFIFFGLITTIGAIYVLLLVPETRGRTLEEMDELFGTTSFAAEDEALRVRIEQEIGLLALLGGEEIQIETIRKTELEGNPEADPVVHEASVEKVES
ncbi:hypothetical protein N7488_001736 [Penicillium malachiteum]|nr:hypothetical protein N7488_001736 [Penicillium malachiteum]